MLFRSKLQKRVEGYSTEAQVYQEGSDRISIEIPGVADANEILSELGRPGSLEFYDVAPAQSKLAETMLHHSWQERRLMNSATP